jgi:hypothetical protein
MLQLLGDLIPPHTFWNDANGSAALWTKIIVSFVVLSALIFAIKDAGPKARRFIVGAATFLAGAFYFLAFVYPQPIHRQPNEMPSGFAEHISFWFDDALPIVEGMSNALSAFLIGLGVFSVLTIHVKKVAKKQRDWGFSVVLLVCILMMVIVGYVDWNSRIGHPELDVPQNWSTVNYAKDFLFNQLLQQMDAAMFSIIAFYILSAAYRAFRIRSVEATILLASALVVMLSLMGAVEFEVNRGATSMLGSSTPFTLTEAAKWLRDNFQTPSIRAIDFGVGLGSFAMALRLWLSLEKQGAN